MAPSSFVISGFALGAILAEQASEKVDVLADGQRRIEIFSKPLRHVGDFRHHMLPLARISHISAECGEFSILDSLHTGD